MRFNYENSNQSSPLIKHHETPLASENQMCDKDYETSVRETHHELIKNDSVYSYGIMRET